MKEKGRQLAASSISIVACPASAKCRFALDSIRFWGQGEKCADRVDTEHHLIVTHEATNEGSDRAQLANIACIVQRRPLDVKRPTA